MARPFFALISLCLLFSACTQRTICPAFQSAYVYDKEALRKKFSYFLEDSTPKILTASKNKYLVAEPVSYRKKLRSLNTVVMKDVNPVLPDSLQMTEGGGLIGEDGAYGEDGVVPGAELDLAARSVIDSVYIVDVAQEADTAAADDVYMISKDKEVRLLKYNAPDTARYDPATGRYIASAPKYTVADIRFNVQQDNYMWYLRKSLVLPDVKLAQLMQQQQQAEAKKEKKGLKGFFKNLFKGKKKDVPDSLATPPPAADDFDYVDENDPGDTPASAPAPAPSQKKGMFSFLKKNDGGAARDVPATSGGRPDAKPVKEKKKKEKKEKKPKDANAADNPAPADDEENDEDGF